MLVCLHLVSVWLNMAVHVNDADQLLTGLAGTAYRDTLSGNLITPPTMGC